MLETQIISKRKKIELDRTNTLENFDIKESLVWNKS